MVCLDVVSSSAQLWQQSAAQYLAACASRAYVIEKGFVRETPLTYVVALSGNTAKDVTQRFAAHLGYTASDWQSSHRT